jgi:chromosome segregation protein
VLLKKLTLVGFKSFADRTRLEFDAGVNVVVGPNGSGKSNLLDAIAWVMGTQATRSLRTEKMEDVVFAGTATRPSVSRAEVALTFDNSDGFLPIDLSEITITRRLYRDGTSEYEMNRTPCRLLDIQELLSDGGVGRHQHVLVSQGQIGTVLTARPEPSSKKRRESRNTAAAGTGPFGASTRPNWMSTASTTCSPKSVGHCDP